MILDIPVQAASLALEGESSLLASGSLMFSDTSQTEDSEDTQTLDKDANDSFS